MLLHQPRPRGHRRDVPRRVVVMYAGEVVEQATVEEIFVQPPPPLHLGPARLRSRRAGQGRRLATSPATSRRSPGRCLPVAGSTRRCGTSSRRPAATRWSRRSSDWATSTPLPPRHASCDAPAARPGREGAEPPRGRGPHEAVLGERDWLGAHQRLVTGGRRRQLHPERGETLGLVGESGAGKSTTGAARAAADRARLGHGALRRGRRARRQPKRPARVRRRMQMVFQDPYSSLDPRVTGGRLGGRSRRSCTSRWIARSARARLNELLDGSAWAATDGAVPGRAVGRPAPAHRHRPRARRSSPTSSSPTNRSPRSTCRCGRRC